MALIIGGATLSGKLGNTVYAKTGWARAYAIPTNPNTTPQAAIRAMIASYPTVFRSFAPADQNAWAEAAKNFPRGNRIGEKYELSGMNFYTSCAMIAQMVQDAGFGVTIPGAGDPPVPETTGTASILQMDLNHSEVYVEATEAIEDDEFWMVFMTAPLSTGINFTRRSRYRLVAIVDKYDFAPTTLTLTSEYAAVFGGFPPIGTKVFAEAFSVVNGEWVKRSAGKSFAIRAS